MPSCQENNTSVNNRVNFPSEAVKPAGNYVDSCAAKKDIVKLPVENNDAERLRMELQRQQAKSKALLEQWPQAIIFLNKTTVTSLNPAASILFGASEPWATANLNIARYLPFATRTRELDRIYALQEGLIPGQQMRPVILLRADGSEFNAEVTEMLWENGEGREMVWLINDISRDQQMQRELEEANSQLKQLSQRLIEVQESERRQIARDLHDDIGQQLTGLKLYLQRLQRQVDNEKATKTLQELVEVTDQALAKVRSLSLALHPLQLETLGLEAAVRWHLSHFLKATHTAWELQIQGELETISAAKAVAAFRIVQEAVNNVVKHARADQLKIMMSRDKQGLRLEIMDDGCGFDVKDTLPETQSLGLTSMRERVSSLGGYLRINSLSGVGTRITAWLPAQSKAPLK